MPDFDNAKTAARKDESFSLSAASFFEDYFFLRTLSRLDTIYPAGFLISCFLFAA